MAWVQAVFVFEVDGGEVGEGAALAVEELHDAHAGDVLLGEGVDAGGGGALGAVADGGCCGGRCWWRGGCRG